VLATTDAPHWLSIPSAMASMRDVCCKKFASRLGLPVTMRKSTHVTAGGRGDGESGGSGGG
jgi:hypothetical protein